MNATTGEMPGPAIHPDEALTLALPKTGLRGVEGPIVLGDISIPAAVYEHLDIPYQPPFDDGFLIDIESLDGVSGADT